MSTFRDLLPDADALLNLAPEELAGVVLQCLSAIDPSHPTQLNRYNFTQPSTAAGFPEDQQDAVLKALMEAWVWLEREGLLAPTPGRQHRQRGVRHETRKSGAVTGRPRRIPASKSATARTAAWRYRPKGLG